eukprot:365399-Chlamydomonas_euryale.AAC.12
MPIRTFFARRLSSRARCLLIAAAAAPREVAAIRRLMLRVPANVGSSGTGRGSTSATISVSVFRPASAPPPPPNVGPTRISCRGGSSNRSCAGGLRSLRRPAAIHATMSASAAARTPAKIAFATGNKKKLEEVGVHGRAGGCV